MIEIATLLISTAAPDPRVTAVFCEQVGRMAGAIHAARQDGVPHNELLAEILAHATPAVRPLALEMLVEAFAQPRRVLQAERIIVELTYTARWRADCLAARAPWIQP